MPTVTHIVQYSEASGDVASKTSGSLSIPANSVVLAFVEGTKGSGSWSTSLDMAISDSVDGTTGWTPVGAWQFSNAVGFGGAGQLFVKQFVSSTSRTITVARVSAGTVFWGYDIVAVTGADGASPIVQAKSNIVNSPGGSDTLSATVTLDAPPANGNAVVWFLGVNNDNSGLATIPSGYTQLVNIPASAANFEGTAAAYNTATTTAAITCTDCGTGIEYAVVCAVEIARAPVATKAPPPPRRFPRALAIR